MKKIKNLVFVSVFLVTQFSYGNSVKVSGAKYELPLSKMILTGEEIAELSNEDRVIYLRALIYLSQVLEASQANVFNYEDFDNEGSSPVQTSQNSFESRSVIQMYWSLFVSKSEALILSALKGAWSFAAWGAKAVVTKSAPVAVKAKSAVGNVTAKLDGVAIKGQAEKLVKVESKLDADRAAVEAFKKTVSNPAQMTPAEAQALKKLEGNVDSGEKALAALKKQIQGAGHTESQVRIAAANLGKTKTGIEAELKKNAKELDRLSKDLEKSNRSGDFAASKDLDRRIRQVQQESVKLQNKFYRMGGDHAAVQAINRTANSSLARRVFVGSAEVAAVAGVATAGVHLFGGNGSSDSTLGAALREKITKARDQNPGSMKKEEGYSCIYGGRPSVLKVNLGVDALNQFFCARPSDSQDDKCKHFDGNFRCNTYGFIASDESMKSTCIRRRPMDTLTERCMGALTTVIESEQNKLTLDKPEELAKFSDNVKKMLELIEGNMMSTEKEGELEKAHSFSYYCKNNKNGEDGKPGQLAECAAISNFVEKIYSRPKIEEILAEKARLAQNGAMSPSSPGTSTPAGATDGRSGN